MEIPSRKQDKYEETLCDPCGSDGERISAEGFCTTCGDFLCADCFEVHTIPRPSRNHILLDKANMPSYKKRKPKSTCTVICGNHHDKVVDFFCPAHNTVFCTACANGSHKLCELMYIPDVADDYRDSKEFGELVVLLNRLERDIDILSAHTKTALKSLKQSGQSVLREIRQFRREFNNYLDEKERELIDVTKKMAQADSTQLQDIDDEMDRLKHKTVLFKEQLASVDTKTSDLFVTSKKIKNDVEAVFHSFIKSVEKSNNVQYTFRRAPIFRHALSPNSSFGTVDRSSETNHISYLMATLHSNPSIDLKSRKVDKLSEVDVKTTCDKVTPRITGMTLLTSNILLLVDWNNKCIKSVDTTSNKPLTGLYFYDYPWDITTVAQHQAAVTFPKAKMVQILSTKDNFKKVRSINVDGNCYGICAFEEKLILCLNNSGKVHIITLTGQVIVSVKTDNKRHISLNDPEYITIVEEFGIPVIHVSDYKKNTITKLSLEGQVLSTYTHKDWRGVDGLTAAGDGQLLICNYENDTIDVVSRGGKTIQTLLTNVHGIKKPESICFSAAQNTLYVSSFDDNTVQSYIFTLDAHQDNQVMSICIYSRT